jgi:hypothetical protein
MVPGGSISVRRTAIENGREDSVELWLANAVLEPAGELRDLARV